MPPELDAAWESLQKSFDQLTIGCSVVVSPHALAIVLADHKKQEQGEDHGNE